MNFGRLRSVWQLGKFWRKYFLRGWRLTRTRIVWGWRLHALGKRTELRRCMQISNPSAVSIGSYVTLESHFILVDLNPGYGPYPKIVIGDGCTFLHRFQCNAAESIHIGNNVLTASNVLVTDSDHVVEPGVPITRSHRFNTKPVRIEDNCWLGQNVVVLKGVTIGHDSIVGANSVVTKDVPPHTVVAGNPAKVIKKNNSE